MKKMLTVYVEAEQLKRLSELRASGYSASALIRKWIKAGLSEMKKGTK
jgi:hypothetical protein